MQGQPADAVLFLLSGKVKLVVASPDGKEGIVATLGAGEFFGEGCLAGQSSRVATAISVGDCSTTILNLPRCLSVICCPESSDTKQISSISCSTPARNAWRGFCCCCRI